MNGKANRRSRSNFPFQLTHERIPMEFLPGVPPVGLLLMKQPSSPPGGTWSSKKEKKIKFLLAETFRFTRGDPRGLLCCAPVTIRATSIRVSRLRGTLDFSSFSDGPFVIGRQFGIQMTFRANWVVYVARNIVRMIRSDVCALVGWDTPGPHLSAAGQGVRIQLPGPAGTLAAAAAFKFSSGRFTLSFLFLND